MSDPLSDLQIEVVSTSALSPRPGNPRTHTQKQIRQIAQSIETFGWTNPILTDGSGAVIAGHGRLEAAKLLSQEMVPAIRLSDLSEDQIRAYVIADNRLAELAGWDSELLAIELQSLSEIDLDFDIEITGFATPEIDGLIVDLSSAADVDDADRLPPISRTRPPVSGSGDLWLLGRHRLLCADATKADSFTTLLGSEKADMVFSDPPYNVPIEGHVCGLGAVRHRDFAMASGEMTAEEFTSFLKATLGHMARVSRSGAIHFICMDWRHLFELLSAGRTTYSDLKNLCVWNKTNGGMGSLYRSKHELVAVFKAGDAPHINNVELGTHGRYRTNVWDYPGINTFGKDRDAELAMHPTVKPVAMIEDAILDCSRRGDIVLDAFTGSGSTIMAAERSGRRGFGLELDPGYVDVTLHRYREATGEEPVHASSGLTLSDLE